MTPRHCWILGRGTIGSVALGPTVRILEMAKAAHSAGMPTTISMDDCSGLLPDGITFQKLAPEIIDLIRPGDAVIASIFLPPDVLRRLLDSGKPFDADFYCVGAFENLESGSSYSPRRLFQGRRRTSLRYRLILERAERIYLSNHEQLAFLGGLLFGTGHLAECSLASSLPQKAMFLPMGSSDEPFPTGNSYPYPESFQGRPIFLWGGGIWSWFDMETLLQAFVQLRMWGSPAALYFLCGKNLSGIATQDGPVQWARQRAEELGLLENTVYFRDSGTRREDLPGLLEHCTAGVMTNPLKLESFGSWRTRLLDLLWSGKPVVTAGFDPLSEIMARNGAGLLVPASDSTALAEALDRLGRDAELQTTCRGASRRLAQDFCWSAVLKPWIQRLHFPESFQSVTRPVPTKAWLQYIAGF